MEDFKHTLPESFLGLLKGHGADKAQCSLIRTTKYEMTVERGDLSLMRTTFDTKLGCTAIKDGRKGSVHINKTDRSSMEAAASQVMDMASASQPDEANDIAVFQEPCHFCTGSTSPDRDLMHRRLKEFLYLAAEQYPEVILRNMYMSFTFNQSCFMNTNGVRFDADRGIYNTSVIFGAKSGDKSSSINYSGFSSLDLDRPIIDCGSVKTLIGQSREQIETASVKGKFEGELIITPDCLDDFISMLVDYNLRDHSLITGTSIYRDMEGKAVASSCFSLHSKPNSDEIPDGYFITPDGYRAENSTIIDRGILNGFVLSLYGSRKTGLPMAKNSGGAYVVDSGSTSYDDMVKAVRKGILLCRFSGGRPSSSGDFSGVAKNSYYIENGEIKYPINETMVSGNLAALFKNIGSISKERLNFGSTLLPWVLAGGVVISGK